MPDDAESLDTRTVFMDIYASFARDHMLHKGAREVLTCVFARKPEAVATGLDLWAWDAPHRYLVGYGMDDAGKLRGLPFVGAIKGA